MNTQQDIMLSGDALHNPQRYKDVNWDTGTLLDGIPVCPIKDKKVKEAWDLCLSYLVLGGHISEQDMPLLVSAFEVYKEYLDCQKMLKKFDKEHLDLSDKNSVSSRKAISSMMKEAYRTWEQTMSSFGLTPTTRKNLPKTENGEPMSLLDAMIEEE